MKWVLLAVSLVSSLAFASNEYNPKDGHSVGNGGGVICINGVCRTLIEAGLRVRPEYDGVWLPSRQLVSDVNASIGKTPFLPGTQMQIQKNIFGRMDHFRAVEVEDPAKLNAIKQLYMDLSKEAGFPLDPNTFEVVAFSSDNTVQPALTYLLPKFFELDGRQQASILFHEGMYRGQSSQNLRYVLQLETALSEFDVNKSDAASVATDASFAAYNLGLMDKRVLLGSIFYYVLNIRGAIVPAGKLGTLKYFSIDGSGGYKTEGYSLLLSPNELINLAEIEPRIPYLFSKVDSIKFLRTGNFEDPYDRAMHETLTTKASGELSLWRVEGDGYGTKAGLYEYEIYDAESLNLVIPK